MSSTADGDNETLASVTRERDRYRRQLEATDIGIPKVVEWAVAVIGPRIPTDDEPAMLALQSLRRIAGAPGAADAEEDAYGVSVIGLAHQVARPPDHKTRPTDGQPQERADDPALQLAAATELLARCKPQPEVRGDETVWSIGSTQVPATELSATQLELLERLADDVR